MLVSNNKHGDAKPNPALQGDKEILHHADEVFACVVASVQLAKSKQIKAISALRVELKQREFQDDVTKEAFWLMAQSFSRQLGFELPKEEGSSN